ncbi:AI-2E family transporter [Mesorhizobium sp. 1B3]|uniref:AI-2E family transporter n=1 Tax=Mesorhizobium sp. 1B3 TaxID=3243599 RepID=UPI003D97B5C1
MERLAVLVVVVAALYFGRDIFVPLALAVLLSFALAPVVSWLRRHGLPRAPAVITVVVLAFLSISAFGALIAGQVTQLGENLPRYQSTIEEKIRSLRSSATEGGLFERASKVLRELSNELERPAETTATSGPTPGEQKDVRPQPIPVQIQQPDPKPLQLLQSVIGPLIEPLATGGIVIVFVVFMLLQREDLRDRFIRLVGGGDLHRTTQALGEAGQRVAKYLLMQVVVNATYGIPVGIGLWLIGIPNPLLWGMLAMVLRFVPYVGPVIAAIFPLALSIAVDPGWTMLLWTAALFIVLELLSNNIVEPWLYGSSTGLSPVAIIAAAIFWTWLWGPVGLLLSTPLTVCLVVLGRHVPQFSFLDVLLGSEPVLTPQESLYQRLLAGDPDEATERAEEFLEEDTLLSYFDEVAIPALALVEHDRARGVLDDEQRALVAAGALTLVDNLSDYEELDPEDAQRTDAAELRANQLPPRIEPGPDWRERPILSAGGRGNLDDAASAILAQLFERCGVGVRTVPFTAMSFTNYASLELEGVRLVCLSYMNSDSLAHARYLVRRVRRRTNALILVGFWSLEPEEAAQRDLVKATRADFCVTTLAEALAVVLDMVPRAAEPFDGAQVSDQSQEPATGAT